MAKAKVTSTRITILGWILLPLIIAMSLGFITTSYVLLNQVSEDIDKGLIQEAAELEVLSQRALDPVTGDSYVDASDILSLYVARSVPGQDEAIFVMVHGNVTERSSNSLQPRLDRNSEFLEIINSSNDPVLSTFESELGSFRYIVIPVEGASDSGKMVAAISIDERQEPIRQILFQLAFLLVLAVIMAGVVGWFVAGRILKPIRDLRLTTQRIKDGDFVERISVSNPGTELGGIATEFNEMLDRIKDSFKSQKRFVDDAGHELKTPLTIVRGHLDLIEVSSDDSKASLEIVRDEVSRMTRIVQDLQTLTKSNEPRFVKLESTSPLDAVDEVFVKSSGLADRNWILTSTECPDSPLDSQRIVQALIQLTDNAIKHTKQGEAIEIGCRATEESVEFFVGDGGPGIPADERDKVRQRFVRGNWTPQDTEGSGLGLAIVDAVARAHGGELLVGESHLGGAELTIRIPLAISKGERGS